MYFDSSFGKVMTALYSEYFFQSGVKRRAPPRGFLVSSAPSNVINSGFSAIDPQQFLSDPLMSIYSVFIGTVTSRF